MRTIGRRAQNPRVSDVRLSVPALLVPAFFRVLHPSAIQLQAHSLQFTELNSIQNYRLEVEGPSLPIKETAEKGKRKEETKWKRTRILRYVGRRSFSFRTGSFTVRIDYSVVWEVNDWRNVWTERNTSKSVQARFLCYPFFWLLLQLWAYQRLSRAFRSFVVSTIYVGIYLHLRTRIWKRSNSGSLQDRLTTDGWRTRNCASLRRARRWVLRRSTICNVCSLSLFPSSFRLPRLRRYWHPYWSLFLTSYAQYWLMRIGKWREDEDSAFRPILLFCCLFWF